MAHATYTADARQAIAVMNTVLEKMKELQQFQTEIKVRTILEQGSMKAVRSDLQAWAKAYSETTIVAIRAKVTGMAAQAKKLREYYAKGIAAKVMPYVTNASLKAVKEQIGKVVGSSTVDVALRFQRGAAQAFRATLKRMLEVLSRGSYVEVQLRMGSLAKALSNVKDKKVTLDVDVRAGTAAKIRALLSLLKSLREGAKIPIKLEIDPGLTSMLKTLAGDLKKAADQASRLNQRLGSAAGASKKVGSAGGGIGIGEIAAGSFIGNMAVKAAQLAVEAFKQLTQVALDFNKNQQQVLIGFQTQLHGSAVAAQALYTDLQRFNDLSPLEEEDIIPSAQKLLAAKMSVEDLKKSLQGIGEETAALGGNGEKFGQIATAIGQIWLKPRLQLEELTQQLIEQGVPAFDLLAKAYHTNTAQIQAWITKGLIPGKEAARALANQMARQNFGAAEKQSRTFAGALSTLSDRMKRGLGGATKSAFDELTRLLNMLVYISGNKDFQKWIARVVSTLAQGFASVRDVVVGTFSVITKSQQTFFSVESSMLSWWVNAWKTSAGFVWNILKNYVHSLAWVADAYTGLFQKAMGGDNFFQKQVDGILGSVESGADQVKDKIIEFGKGIYQAAKDTYGPGFDLGKMIGNAGKYADGGLSAGGKMPALYTPTLGDPKAKAGRSEAEKSADRERKASLAEHVADLNKDAAAQLARAKIIDDTARREIERIKGIRDSTKELFGGMQQDLLKLGILNDPLAPLLRGFESLIGYLEQARDVAGPAAKKIQAATDAAALDKENAKRARVGAIRNPHSVPALGGSGSLAPADPRLMAVVSVLEHGDKLSGQAKKLVDDVERQFAGLTRSYYSVPKAWGKAVKDSEGYSGRFMMQTQLATAEGQKMLAEFADAIQRPNFPKVLAAINKAWGTTFSIKGKGLDAAADFMRQFANQVDVVAESAKRPLAIEAATAATTRLNAETRQSIKLLADQANFLTGNKDPKAFERFKAIQAEGQRLHGAADSPVAQLLKIGKTTDAHKAYKKLMDDFIGKYDAEQTVSTLSEGNASDLEKQKKQEELLKTHRTAIAQAIKDLEAELKSRSRLQGYEADLVADESLTQKQRDILIEGQKVYWQKYDELRKAGLKDPSAHKLAGMAGRSVIHTAVIDQRNQSADQESQNLLAQKVQLVEEYAQRQLELKGALTALDRAELEWRASDAARARDGIELTGRQQQALAKLRNEVRGLLRDQEKLNDVQFLKDQQRSTIESGIYDPELLRKIRITRAAKEAGIPDNVIQEQLPQLEQLDKLREYRERVGEVVAGVRDDITNMFANIQEKGLSSIGDLFDSIASRLNQLGAQILADKVWSYIAGALGGMLAGSPATPSYSMGSGSGVSLRSHAIGLRYVPYDGYVARLHQGESILTRRETEMHAAIAAGPSRSASNAGSGSASNITINGGITLPNVRSHRDFGSEVRKAVERQPAMSRRSSQNLAYDRVSPGGKQR